METLLILILLVVVLGIASLRWGTTVRRRLTVLSGSDESPGVCWKTATTPGVKRPRERDVN
jgi:hypothetical protein